MRKLFILPIIALMMVGCGQTNRTEVIKGNDGKDGVSMGIDVSSTAPSCIAGGSTIKTYVDTNSNSELDSGELIKQVAVVCNGVDGTSVTVAVASATDCPTGGITIDNSYHICNGAQGTMGPQGPAGPQGPSGSVGNITPVQLCPGDTATFKEQGFIVGGSLYAVYYNHNAGHAFLAKLNPGNYITTNGSGCTFNYANNGTTITLSNGSGTTTVPVNSGSTSTVSNQYRIDLYTDSNNTNNLVATYIVTNAGLVNWTISPATGHGFVINNNANNLGKANCNINNLTSVTTTQQFENCIVTKL